jgi:hypothetical protein
LLQRAAKVGIWYRIVVLDARFPADRGEDDELHPELREEVQSITSRGAVIFHITAYRQDLERHLGSGGPHEPKPVILDKADPNWTRDLCRYIGEEVHSGRIAEKTDRLFGPSNGTGVRVALRVPRGTRNATHDLADLQRDIAQHWRYLAPELRHRIQTIFRVSHRESGDTEVDPL